MKIIRDLLSVLDCRVPVADIRQGPFQTAVLTRYCGLASTPHEAGHHHGTALVKEAGMLQGKEARALAQLAESDSLFEAAIGMATINSLLEVDEDRCLELNAGNLLAEKGRGKRVAVVGHFPFTSQLRESVKELHVIEKNPSEGDNTESDAEEIIPQADVVGITGTAFTNHTMEGLLELCRPGAFVVLLGDTAPLSGILFDYNIDAVCGTRVVNPELAMKCVGEGATYRQIKGIRRLIILKQPVI